MFIVATDRISAERRALPFSRHWEIALGVFWLAFGQQTVFSQGTSDGLTLLRTDSSTALHSESFSFLVPMDSASGSIDFHFGFETNEKYGPGGFFDSLTLTLRSADGSITLVLLTADASGVVFAPPTPGTTPIAESSLLRTAIIPPALNPNLSLQYAFSLKSSLPGLRPGEQATLYLDLFDNNDGIASQGWMDNFSVVPEPSSCALFAVAAAGLIFQRFRRKR